MRIWTTVHLLGIFIQIQVQCFEEGICPRKDPPRGAQVLAPGTEVILHCSGRVSVNGVDIAETDGVPKGRAEGDIRDKAHVEEVHEEPETGMETVTANRSRLMNELGLPGRAGGMGNLTGEDRGSMDTGLSNKIAGGAMENASASTPDGAYAGTLGTAGRLARGLKEGVQWRVNGRLRTRGREEEDMLLLAPLKLSDRGNYSCLRDGRKVFSIEILVGAPLEQPTLSCYRKTPTSKIRCDWTAKQPVTPTPQCYLILQKGLYGPLSKVNCSFSPSRARCWCVMEHREEEKDSFQAALCLTSITGNVTSPIIQIHPENIIKPDPPTNVTVLAEDNMEHRLKVTWRYPRSWSSHFYYLEFQLEYFPILNGEAKEVQSVLTKGMSYTINDILTQTTYLIRIRAKEEFDLGQWSSWSPHVYARSWAAPEPSATSELHSSSEPNPFDPFFSGSGETPSVSPSLLRPTLTFHLSWVVAACVLVIVMVLAVYILRHREKVMSKLFKLVRSSTSNTPGLPPSQLPREGNPLVSTKSLPPPILLEEERSDGIHLNNMGYFLVQTN
ncbi:hypothetical protein GJAV_G00007870 [Gymnothorax javanicus]|nr:hypothetical protein GJAV_G00007870 [Gymnothorax javanicus]